MSCLERNMLLSDPRCYSIKTLEDAKAKDILALQTSLKCEIVLRVLPDRGVGYILQNAPFLSPWIEGAMPFLIHHHKIATATSCVSFSAMWLSVISSVCMCKVCQ